MRDRIILLSHLIPWLNYRTVWDCELWEWRSYAAMHDEYVRQMKEGANG